jgi:hypothetical protein
LILATSFLVCTSLQASLAAEFSLCSDFGCKTRTEASYSDPQWRQIERLFVRPALSPWLEKQRIRRAVALMEQFSGAINGSTQDIGGNYNGIDDLRHQMDCIDESTNTEQYLQALERRGLLHWHRVESRQQRSRLLIFAHWSAVIHDLSNDRRYVVDSWYEDNGQPPYIQPLEAWTRARAFSPGLNPPLGLL